MNWTGHDGWPIDYPPQLISAIREIPNCVATDAEVDHLARRLALADEAGRWAIKMSQQRKSATQNEEALLELHELCHKLAAHLENIPLEACQSLSAEGVDLFALRSLIEETQEQTRYAFSGLEAPPRVSGRPIKHHALMVADEAASVYQIVSAKAPTYTGKLIDSVPRRRGPWPEFLAKVFEALMIDASTDTHAERIAKSKKAPEKDQLTDLD